MFSESMWDLESRQHEWALKGVGVPSRGGWRQRRAVRASRVRPAIRRQV